MSDSLRMFYGWDRRTHSVSGDVVHVLGRDSVMLNRHGRASEVVVGIDTLFEGDEKVAEQVLKQFIHWATSEAPVIRTVFDPRRYMPTVGNVQVP